ncbi:hypothetical protein MLD38_009301 [Melastoma candidum]|uniref:Uncharacterized protein n=1 Tax=Melastoma candidum TaxID=119954 RepID=A0ACB9S5M9_9MYRT|nr:hypothetical protein MLD38_009301 [Melastoma candidum]
MARRRMWFVYEGKCQHLGNICLRLASFDDARTEQQLAGTNQGARNIIQQNRHLLWKAGKMGLKILILLMVS